MTGVLGLAIGACSKPVGLDTPVTPLAQIHVQLAGDLSQVMPADAGAGAGNLHAALVWGLQWLPEPFCVLPPESPAAAAVIAAGCPDPFGFVPDRVGADTPIAPGSPASWTWICAKGVTGVSRPTGLLHAPIARPSTLVNQMDLLMAATSPPGRCPSRRVPIRR